MILHPELAAAPASSPSSVRGELRVFHGLE